MKKQVLKFTMAVLMVSVSMVAFAGKTVVHEEPVTTSFKVYGNCGMCKSTIEGSLKSVKGVEKAEWNRETKMMEVTYYEDDITLDDIKKKIAKAGYDTEEFRAEDKVYKKLPGCCQYERPAKKE